MPRTSPAEPDAARFRLPVEPPTRNLLIASLASIAGGCQLFAWALARLPTFFLWFGLAMVGLALGLGLAALVRHYRLRWVVFVGPQSFTILRGSRQQVLPWETIGAVSYDDFRLRVVGLDGARTLATLPVDRTRPAHRAAQDIVRAAELRLATRA